MNFLSFVVSGYGKTFCVNVKCPFVKTRPQNLDKKDAREIIWEETKKKIMPDFVASSFNDLIMEIKLSRIIVGLLLNSIYSQSA